MVGGEATARGRRERSGWGAEADEFATLNVL